MRILVLVHEYPPVGGGGGRVAQELCEGLAARGHHVHVLTAHWGDLPQEEKKTNLLIQRLRSGRRQSFRAGMGAMLGYVLACLPAGLSLIKKWRPDLIHVHFAVPAGAAAWVLNRLTRTPYVLTAHLGDVPGGVPEKTAGWFRWVMPFTPPIWKRAARVAAVSEFTRSLALKQYPVNVQVIPNGVDLQQVKPDKIQAGNPPQIVFAGRFVEQKNPLQIVRSLANLQNLPWSCTLIGDGALRPQVEAEIARFGMEARFTLTGWVAPEEVLRHFAQSDILFMPSRTEGLPVVGVQALAMALALVLGRAGGNIELVEEGKNGYLVEPDDQAGFEHALRELLSSPERLQAARETSRTLAERFDLKQILDGYETLFKEMVR